MDKKELTEMIAYLKNAHEHFNNVAKDMFPHHPESARHWAALKAGCCKDNNMQTVVDTLGLSGEYAEYLRDVNVHFEKGASSAASMTIVGWMDFLSHEIERDFYMFKGA